MIAETCIMALLIIGSIATLALVAAFSSWLADTVHAWIDRRRRK